MSKESPQSKQAIESATDRRWLLGLIGLGILLLICEIGVFEVHVHDHFYWILFWLLISGIPFVLAVWLVFRRRAFPGKTLWVIFIGAGLFRVFFLPLDPPRLSTDIYRYIWDGRVQGSGINPYLYLPVDPRLAGLRDNAIYPHINRKEYAHTDRRSYSAFARWHVPWFWYNSGRDGYREWRS